MLAGLTGWHLLILLAIVLLVFGAAKLPALAKSVGQSARIFKGEVKAMKEEDAAAKPYVADPSITPAASPTVQSSEAPRSA